ncbi:GNAT family N-acetyltransferase [Marinococcus luteus]|uniref:GNAT family N-acetyltransferase n=1 Tax=Marinococcus luteus TaxID=1122204 RepID=UPI002ACC95AB|nr:GNAT family N-acetyltransferase [Marinococcus luteus]MDZ5781922.1 GNAT family N-acetyltransferase [Marinococcus luteus]
MNIYEKEEGIIVRRFRAEEDDIDVLTTLLHQAYQPLADQGFRYLATHQSAKVTRERLEKGQGFIAWDRGTPVATITYYGPEIPKDGNWYKQPGVGVAGQFGVRPDYQSNGLGSFLLATVEHVAREQGSTELALDTSEGATHLRVFYERRGYRFIEYADWNVTNYKSVVLSKTL